jgi:hypothetical protein
MAGSFIQNSERLSALPLMSIYITALLHQERVLQTIPIYDKRYKLARKSMKYAG